HWRRTRPTWRSAATRSSPDVAQSGQMGADRETAMRNQRTILGVLAMLLVVLAGQWLLPDLGRSMTWMVAQSLLVFFLGALAGAWVARGPFVCPALVAWGLVWVLVLWLLQRIAAPVGHWDLAAVLQFNWLALVVSFFATLAGALSAKSLGPRPE